MKSAKAIKAQTTKTYNETVENMRLLGTYKPEFEASIRRYADLRMQYDILRDRWYEEGCLVTENYTNKSGATNQRKTSLYLALEALRKELIDTENIFGLTPKGLKMIKTNGLNAPKSSKLDELLSG